MFLKHLFSHLSRKHFTILRNITKIHTIYNKNIFRNNYTKNKSIADFASLFQNMIQSNIGTPETLPKVENVDMT